MNAAHPSAKHLVSHTNGLSPFVFGLLSVLLGAVAGLGAFVFRALIAFVHNLAFLGRMSFVYDTNQHTPASHLGSAVVLVPVVGAMVVVFLVRRFAPEAKGHGVPEVMDAIYYQKSVIRPVVAVVKSIASAISIGTGGSVGREGPIIQIGASFASTTGRLLGASQWQRATLVAAGGGAGIAATFNTPIGGVLFAVEVLLHEVSGRTLVPLALATTTATFVGRSLFGNTPAFAIPHLGIASSETVASLVAAVVLGALMALVSVVFIRSLYGTEDFFDKDFFGSDYIRHGAGMLTVGVLFQALLMFKGHYYIQGVGYATIMDVLSAAPTGVWFLILLAFLKLVSACLTLGSGGSGGIFSPSLFMGATLGAAYGIALCTLFPDITVDPRVFALVGMTALVAGATGAALTAIVMIFEMTLDYSVVLPLTLAAAVSYGLRRAILTDSIYTLKLARRGHVMPGALQANAHMVHQIADIAMAEVVELPAESSPEVLQLDDDSAPTHYAVVRDDKVIGILTRDWALGHSDLLQQASSLEEIVQSDFIVMSSDATVFDLMATMQKARASLAVVVAPTTSDTSSGSAAKPQILGVVTKAILAEALAEGMELFED